MDITPDIAPVAAHFAERSRARMMMALLDGTSRPASHLAAVAQVNASTASEHLARLIGARLLVVERRGRTRRYRLAGPEVVVVLEALIPLAGTARPSGLRQHQQWQRLRVARTCYDHLAGSLGTDVLAGLLEVEALRRCDGLAGTVPRDCDVPSASVSDAPYALGRHAQEVFGRIGIDLGALAAARRPLIRICMDWTEQRHHLAGGLGAAVCRALVERGWVLRREGRRDLAVRAPDQVVAWLHGAPVRPE